MILYFWNCHGTGATLVNAHLMLHDTDIFWEGGNQVRSGPRVFLITLSRDFYDMYCRFTKGGVPKNVF